MDYIVVKYQPPNYDTFPDMKYFLVTFGKVGTPDASRQTESSAYILQTVLYFESVPYQKKYRWGSLIHTKVFLLLCQ